MSFTYWFARMFAWSFGTALFMMYAVGYVLDHKWLPAILSAAGMVFCFGLFLIPVIQAGVAYASHQLRKALKGERA